MADGSQKDEEDLPLVIPAQSAIASVPWVPPGCPIKVDLENLRGWSRPKIWAGRFNDLVSPIEPCHLIFVDPPKFHDVSFVYWDKLVLIVPLHASNGGEEVVLHPLPNLLNVVTLVSKDSPIHFLP